MKKILFVIMLVMNTLVNNAEVLPMPQTTGGMPLMEAMTLRQSSRDINADSQVTRQELSNILWAAWGITHDGKHTVGTAMNRQELEIFVITAEGISKYNPADITLTMVNSGDYRAFAGAQPFAVTAPLNIALVVDTSKQEMEAFQTYSAAAASQNIYLYCASAGLKTVVRASFDHDNLAKAMKLGENEKVMFVQSVGR